MALTIIMAYLILMICGRTIPVTVILILPLIEKEEVIELNPDQSRFTTDFTNKAVDFIDKNKKKSFLSVLSSSYAARSIGCV